MRVLIAQENYKLTEVEKDDIRRKLSQKGIDLILIPTCIKVLEFDKYTSSIKYEGTIQNAIQREPKCIKCNKITAKINGQCKKCYIETIKESDRPLCPLCNKPSFLESERWGDRRRASLCKECYKSKIQGDSKQLVVKETNLNEGE